MWKWSLQSRPSDPDEEHLLPSDVHPLDTRGPSWRVYLISMVLTATLSACLTAWITSSKSEGMDLACIRHTSKYSPVVDDVPMHYAAIRFNGSLLKANIYRQDAGPGVDAAWKALGVDYTAARIPASKAAQSGLTRDHVRIKAKYGGGYPAHIEGLHHLHCLNLLRKSLPWNIAYYRVQGLGPFSNSEQVLKYHVTHCLDTLRQQLMCTVDVGVLGQVWYQPPDKADPEPFVDFNTVHMCRNFEGVREWAQRHQLPRGAQVPSDFLEAPKTGTRIWGEVP